MLIDGINTKLTETGSVMSGLATQIETMDAAQHLLDARTGTGPGGVYPPLWDSSDANLLLFLYSHFLRAHIRTSPLSLLTTSDAGGERRTYHWTAAALRRDHVWL